MLTHSPVAALRKSCRFQSPNPASNTIAPRRSSTHISCSRGFVGTGPEFVGFLLGSFAEFDHVHARVSRGGVTVRG